MLLHGDTKFLAFYAVLRGLAGNGDRPLAWVFESSNHAQQRTLTAARCADQCNELTASNVEIDVRYGIESLTLAKREGFTDVGQRDLRGAGARCGLNLSRFARYSLQRLRMASIRYHTILQITHRPDREASSVRRFYKRCRCRDLARSALPHTRSHEHDDADLIGRRQYPAPRHATNGSRAE